MKAAVIKNKGEKARFGLVGLFNTGLDFGILFLLHSLGFTSIFANYISTSVAFLFSFNANRRFTFKSNGKVMRQFILFIAITLFGLWVIQPIVLWLVEPMLHSIQLTDWVSLLVAKLMATCISLVWNYVWYSRVVFVDRSAI